MPLKLDEMHVLRKKKLNFSTTLVYLAIKSFSVYIKIMIFGG